jgi:actin related protein 2/3 complex subunit 1A/1B
MQEVEEDVDAGKWGAIFSAHNQFGECLWEFDQSSGWVESVAFSPSGDTLAWTSHDSSLFVSSFTGSPNVVTINHPFLPFVDIAFLGNNTIVAAGYNNNAYIFANTGDSWTYVDKIDKEGGSGKPEEKKSGFNKNISKFQDATSKGIGIGKEAASSQLKTLHQNAIMQVTPFFKGAVSTEVVTTGIDGRLQVWDLSGDAAAYKLK